MRIVICAASSARAGGWRRSGRPASAAFGTPRSRTTGGTRAAAVLAAARDLRERSFGPATAKYRELGTLANLLTFNAISALPTRNFQAAAFDGAAELAEQTAENMPDGPDGESVAGMRRVARSSCASCTIGCEHIYRV